MKLRVALALLGLPGFLRAEDDFFDRLRDALTVASADGTAGARLSGTLDFESYHFQAPAPGLIEAGAPGLFNPRLSLFGDAQLGTKFYAFAQLRVDRGFDPAEQGLDARLDEYALRYTPYADGRISVQAGKFATVVGNWVQRHGSWENPFVTAPLPYENVTGIWESMAVRTSGVLLAWAHLLARTPNAAAEAADKHLRSPVIWGPSYASGVSVFGEIGRISYAAEVKNAALASQPRSWDFDRNLSVHPTASARLGYRPILGWNLGFSASSGSYLRPSAGASIPAGYGRGDYRQVVLGPDVSFAWHHWQVWLEAFRTRFTNPRIGDVVTDAAYVELKYKFTPRLSGAVRWNRQVFGDVTHLGNRQPWGRDTWRLDLAPSYRLSAHVQLKVQYSYQEEPGSPQPVRHTLATQATVRF